MKIGIYGYGNLGRGIESAVKYCRHCGKKIDYAGGRFCKHCGKSFL